MTFTGCGGEGDGLSGDCDPELDVPTRQVQLRATGTFLRERDNSPVEGIQAEVKTWKNPCGESAKGEFEYPGTTNANGQIFSGVVSYNIHNAEDTVSIWAEATGLPGHEANEIEILYWPDIREFVGPMQHIELFVYLDDEQLEMLGVEP